MQVLLPKPFVETDLRFRHLPKIFPSAHLQRFVLHRRIGNAYLRTNYQSVPNWESPRRCHHYEMASAFLNHCQCVPQQCEGQNCGYAYQKPFKWSMLNIWEGRNSRHRPDCRKHDKKPQRNWVLYWATYTYQRALDARARKEDYLRTSDSVHTTHFGLAKFAVETPWVECGLFALVVGETLCAFSEFHRKPSARIQR